MKLSNETNPQIKFELVQTFFFCLLNVYNNIRDVFWRFKSQVKTKPLFLTRASHRFLADWPICSRLLAKVYNNGKARNNGKWSDVFDRFSHAEHESGLKSCPPRIVFVKMGVETPKNGVFGHFWISAGNKYGVLEPSKISQIETCNFLFRVSGLVPTVIQKWPKTPFLWVLSPISSETIHDGQLLSPDSSSAYENLSKTPIVDTFH